MANSLVTIDMVTREALRIAHETSVFIATTDRSYDDSYARTGAKIGSTLRVRKPNQYVRTQGSRVMDVQDQAELTADVTVATQDHVDMRFNSAELSLEIDELSKRYIEPAVKALISGIEADYIAYCTKKVYNAVGAAGTFAVGGSWADLVGVGAARGRLNKMLAPKDGNRYVMFDSGTMGTMVNGLKGLFQDSNQIKTQYREGMIGRTGGADWYENDRMWSLTNSADITCTLASSAAVTDGGTNITLASVTTYPTTAGMVFTVPGVYACHPETKQSLGYLQPFTIVTGGLTTQAVSPATYLTGARQNICSVAGAALATTYFDDTGLVPVFLGTTGTYVQNLMYHKEAFQFVTADLPLMAGADKCVRRTQDGLSLRVWTDGDIRNDELLMRIDILYGMAAIRPEWACRMSL